MTAVLRVGVCTFRTLNDPLSGELHVLSGSSRRSGAREHRNPAKRKSRAPLAGSDDGNGPTDGESAHTSAAHAAGQDPCTDSAGTDGTGVLRAPKDKDGEEPTERQASPITKTAKPLPKDIFEFLKEVNEDIQMVEVAKSLLKDEDSRIKQKVFQQLMSIGYAKTLRSKTEKVRTYINDLPQAVRD